MKAVNLILRLALGGIFVAAGVTKIWPVKVKTAPFAVTVASYAPDASEFADSVLNYRLPPRELNNLVAITFPWIELLAGGLLMCGTWKRASTLVITVLMVVFLIAIGQAVARGLNISCGCFGTVEGRKVGLTALAEDTGMLAAALWLLWRDKQRRENPA
jgi:putative oxidoreductase